MLHTRLVQRSKRRRLRNLKIVVGWGSILQFDLYDHFRIDGVAVVARDRILQDIRG